MDKLQAKFPVNSAIEMDEQKTLRWSYRKKTAILFICFFAMQIVRSVDWRPATQPSAAYMDLINAYN